VDHDERPTPDLGYPVQPERRRVRTPVMGVPEYIPPIRARSRADTDDLEIDPDLERAFDVLLKRRLRPVKAVLGIVATLAIGGVGGAIKGAIDGARTSERDRVRIEHLERDLERVQVRLERSPVSRRDPVTQPDSPASKGPP
jgi:hypothetical protein